MSPPPLCHGAATDFESDSDYLHTPVDAPASCQPLVAEYAPLRDYYVPRDAYSDGSEYVPAQAAASPRLAQSGDADYVGAPASIRTPYPVDASDGGCSQVTSPATAYLVTSSNVSSNGSVGELPAPSTRQSARGIALVHLKPPTNDLRMQYSLSRAQYSEHGANYPGYGERVAYSPTYSKPTLHHSNLMCNTNSPMISSNLSLHRSYATIGHPAFAGNSPYTHSPYYDDAYADSPIDESMYNDQLPSGGCGYEVQGNYDRYLHHPHAHPSTQYTVTSGQTQPSIRFYQPPSCPYSYPRVDPPGEVSTYGSNPMSPSLMNHAHPVIHAPRPQLVTDLHTLHTMDDAQSGLASHRVLSIPSIPAPPPVTRPSSLIEDSPKKPLTLACFFCRKRKIACQSPPASSPDRTCNQCAKRKLKCVYPAASRRGIRPRVYDLADETFRRPSLPLSL